jgi:heme/copper-type cytochrome/quinol oxidase subunit 2
MRGIIKVVTHEEYVLWLAGQKSNYDQVMAGKTNAVAEKN